MDYADDPGVRWPRPVDSSWPIRPTGPAARRAEIAAIVAEDGFWSLQAPIVRVTTPDTHIPFSPPLEAQLYPSAERIADAARQTLN